VRDSIAQTPGVAVSNSLHVCVLSGKNAGALDGASAFLVHGSLFIF
jgi:hypothetical protein